MNYDTTIKRIREARQLERELDKHLLQLGITSAQLNVIDFIVSKEDTGEPAFMGAIKDVLDVTPAVVTGIVDRLEKRGFVERSGHHSDRRITRVLPLPAGRALHLRAQDLVKRLSV